MTTRYIPSIGIDPIPAQTQTTYEDYKKIKGFEDVGYFLQAYVVSGGVVTPNVNQNDKVDVSEIVVSLNNDIIASGATTFRAKIKNTVYYLDFSKDGSFKWDTAHPAGTAGTDYLPIAVVTTKSNGMIDVITDARGPIGGFRLKNNFDLVGYATDAELQEDMDAVNAQLADIAINVVTMGADPTGTIDSTAQIQAAFNAGKSILVPPGTYLIDAVTKLRVPSNRIIEWQKGAIFKVIPNASESYRVLDLFAAENVTLYNPTLIGDRDEHTYGPGTHEYGHGIVFSTAKNIKIYNATCNNFTGDGIAVVGGEDVYIENLKCDNNRRQGVSIVRANDFTINGALLTNINGTAPQCGIDLEVNVNTDYLKNIKLLNVTTVNCAEGGIMVITAPLFDSTEKEISIEIQNHKDYGSQYGFILGDFEPTSQFSGYINNLNPYYEKNGADGVFISEYSSAFTPNVLFQNPVIIDSNELNVSASFPQYTSGFVLRREAAGKGSTKIGNITISNPIILDTRSVKRVTRGVYLSDLKSIGVDKISIINPKSNLDLTSKIDFTTLNGGITLLDGLGDLILDTTTQFNSLDNRAVTKFKNTGAPQSHQVNISNNYRGNHSVEFINTTSFGMLVVPPAGANIMPLSSVSGKYIQTTQVGASIKIRRLSDTLFIVEEMIGNWIVQDALLTGSTVWNPASLATGTGETSADITVSGAALGDFAVVSAPYDLQGITASGYVSAAGIVKIRIQNNTGGTVDLASGTWRVRIIKP
ncbi:right-handed parallel beta-helix repeat-containing protein [Paenibacillus sp. LHD-117]|uniref:right-handed parallel beta-helix repeat-containing protein n=1 Tax=Paenibacillus sp. LHD-117 TaxID=3071412 RepID=UPI0027DF4F13|nr:right-handed parallel beta-helix repeat-containing protein [Paenibacillus sp. LHD-117]MDQ6418674.1 right-handed parallel beta-helix repeat-containing protein [Paenibacillus sp. LHD-117]